MNAEDLRWLVGIALTAAGMFAGVFVSAFRILSGRIEGVSGLIDDVSRDRKESDDQLHERINRVRDEYVRRVDLDGHLARIDKKLDDIAREKKETSRALLDALRGRP